MTGFPFIKEFWVGDQCGWFGWGLRFKVEG